MKAFSILLFCVILIGCEDVPKESDQLSMGKTIGNIEDNNFIGSARDIAFDKNKHIYIADLGLKKVHKYTSEGDYIRSFGQEGKGPAEFTGNINVVANDSLILVYDMPGYRVSFFDTSGIFLRSFQIESMHNTKMYLSENDIIAGTSLSPFEDVTSEHYQFHKYDKEGNTVSSFGKFPLTGTKDENVVFLYRKNLQVEKNLLFVSYQFLPIFQIYDTNSEEMVKEINLLELEPFKKKFAENILNAEGAEALQQQMQGLKSIASYFFMSGNSIFFYHTEGEEAYLEEFELQEDLSLEFVNTFSFNEMEIEPGRILDFIYIPQSNSFYALENSSMHGFRVVNFKR